MTPGAALITGAARRVGRAMALDLAAQGWSLALHYHSSSAQAEETASLCRAAGAPKACLLQADICDEAQTSTLVAEATALLGQPLTLLINNASIFEMDTLASATRASWDRHLESNLRAPVVLTQHFAAQCPPPSTHEGEPEASGLVINMLDQRVRKLTPLFASYTIAKMGLWAFTQTAAQALAPQIRVNGIGPGPTLANDRQTPEHFARQRKNTLLERGANLEDICAALRYLISARAVTGQMIAVDGGQHLGWRTPDIIGIAE
ncbi:MAG: SDR family oxidoreductase [Neomegalonema sp.]|nr:SDR family oxidoreductase [Neomegalonema sp.]